MITPDAAAPTRWRQLYRRARSTTYPHAEQDLKLEYGPAAGPSAAEPYMCIGGVPEARSGLGGSGICRVCSPFDIYALFQLIAAEGSVWDVVRGGLLPALLGKPWEGDTALFTLWM